MDVLVDGVLEWAPLQPGDLDALWELTEAIDYLDDAVDPTQWDDLFGRFRRPGADPQRDAIVGRDRGGTIVAWGWNLWSAPSAGHPAVCWLDGGVHPAWRHHGIGTRLLDWQIQRAREWCLEQSPDASRCRTVVVARRVDARVPSHGQVLAEAGLVPERWYIDMHTPDDADLPAVRHDVLARAFDSFGERVQIRPYELVRSEEVRELHNNVFSAMGATPVARGQWEASMRRDAARPEWSWVALADDDVVGYALNSAYPPDGDSSHTECWTDRIGVDPTWRRQGIATALLDASQRSFAAAGLSAAGVGLDTRNAEDAVTAFQRCGYEVADQVALYSARLTVDGSGTPRWDAPAQLS